MIEKEFEMIGKAMLLGVFLALLSLSAAAQPRSELFVLDPQTLYYVGGCQDVSMSWVWGNAQVTLNCPYLPAGTPIAPGSLIRKDSFRGALWDYTVHVGAQTWMGEGCLAAEHGPNPNGGTTTILHCPLPVSRPLR